MDVKALQRIIWGLYLVVVVLVVLGLAIKDTLMIMLLVSVIVLLCSFVLARTWKQKLQDVAV